MITPLPAFIKDFANILAEHIFSLSMLSGITASLNEFPEGEDRLRMGLTLVFWTTAVNGLERNFLNGGLLNGPATNPFRIQSANASVIWAPFSVADLAFFSIIPGKSWESFTRSFPLIFDKAFSAVSLSESVQSHQHCLINFSSFTESTGEYTESG
jgi:hypothetical protein